MTVDALLADLSGRGIVLFVEADRLRFRAPAGALTPELSAVISENRGAIIERLRASTPLAASPLRQRCQICDRKNWVDDPPHDGRIRTTCRLCGSFIGFRPVKA